MVKALLWGFDRSAGLWRALGVDYPRFRAILEIKLLMDGRRRGLAAQNTTSRDRNTFVWSLVFYAFMGFFMGLTGTFAGETLFGMSMVHAFVMVMITMSLIADFSSVLLDTRDNAALQPRPVDGRTMLMARLAHIAVYLASLALSLSAGTVVLGAFQVERFGLWFVPVFLLTLAASVTLVVFVVHVFYLAAMRIWDLERFRDVILYVQMFMAVAVVGGYQLMPRLTDVHALKTLRIEDCWWVYLAPPCWMAAPLHMLSGHVNATTLTLTGLAIGAPLVGLVLVVWVLAPGFGRALSQLEATADAAQTARHATGPDRGVWMNRFAGWLTKPGVERAAFELVWQLSSRDRQFKMRVYPTAAFLLLIGGVMLLGDNKSVSEALANLPETKKYLLILYFACMMSPTAVFQQRFSSQGEAAWIYTALPVDRPGRVLVGALKVMLVRFVAFAFAGVAVLTLAIWGWRILPDVVLAGCATLLVAVLQALIFARSFPFSVTFGVAQGSGRIGRTMLWMLFPATLGGLHVLLQWSFPQAVFVAIPLVVVLALLLLREYSQLGWRAVKPMGA